MKIAAFCEMEASDLGEKGCRISDWCCRKNVGNEIFKGMWISDKVMLGLF